MYDVSIYTLIDIRYYIHQKHAVWDTSVCARRKTIRRIRVSGSVSPSVRSQAAARFVWRLFRGDTHAAPPGARRLFHRFGRRRRRRRRLIRRPARTTRLNPDLRRRRRREPCTADVIIICPLSIYCPCRTRCRFRWPWFVRTFPNNKPVRFYYLSPTNDKQHTARKP